MTLTTYLRAGHPGLAIVTSEEVRAEAELNASCKESGHHLHAWSSTSGLTDLAAGRSVQCADPLDAMNLLDDIFGDNTIRHAVLMRDLQLHLDHRDPLLVRRIKDALRTAKSNGHALVLVGCRLDLPAELEHEITRVDFGLPDTLRLGEVLDGILVSSDIAPPDESARELALQGALGLTTTEAENAFALSVVETGVVDHRVVAREKGRALKHHGLVEVVEGVASLHDIGGLEYLKDWLIRRSGAFGSAARDYGLPAPKGLLITGIPGTGKSLTAKATAGAFGLPLLRLDMGRVFGGIVGQSEANLRAVFGIAEAMAPCVLWIDEIEKGFSGTQLGATDSGTSARVFGSFLSWMQEKSCAVFVVATANDVSKLPPEFLRKGRFDEMFFVDLPDVRERGHIWRIVISRHGRNPADFDTEALARSCDQYTGAEIEAVFIDALHEAYAEGREPSPADLMAAMSTTVPIARLMDGNIVALRTWAKGRAREAGGTPVAQPSRSGRRVSTLN